MFIVEPVQMVPAIAGQQLSVRSLCWLNATAVVGVGEYFVGAVSVSAMYVSTDGGKTWGVHRPAEFGDTMDGVFLAMMCKTLPDQSFLFLAVGDAGKNLVGTAPSAGLHVSWAEVAYAFSFSSGKMRAVVENTTSGGTQYFMCGLGNTILRSTDHEVWISVAPAAAALVNTRWYTMSAKGGRVVVASQDGLIYHSDDMGAADHGWVRGVSGTSVTINNLAQFDKNNVIATGDVLSGLTGDKSYLNGRCYFGISTDGAVSWSFERSTTFRIAIGRLSVIDRNEYFAMAVNSPLLYHTTNGALSWEIAAEISGMTTVYSLQMFNATFGIVQGTGNTGYCSIPGRSFLLRSGNFYIVAH